MESNKRPLKRLPQVTLWELKRHTITVRNPLAWDKTGSDKPIQRDIGDLTELCLHRAGEGSTPLFDRDDILVNQDGMEQRTMRIKKTGGNRSQSTSSSSSSSSSRSKDSKTRSKGWRETKTTYPKPLRFTCERKTSPGKEDSHRRKQSVSPYRRGPKRKLSKSPELHKSSLRIRDVSPSRRNRSSPRSNRTPSRSNRSPPRSNQSPFRSKRSSSRSKQSPSRSNRSPLRSNRSPPRSNRSPLRSNRSPPRSNRSPPRSNRSPPRNNRSPPSQRPRSPLSHRNRSPPRSGKSLERGGGSSHSKSERLRESHRRSRSRDRFKRSSPSLRSPRLSGSRHRSHRNQSPTRQRDYSPHKDQIPPIDYAHLAHVITHMYPRQPFVPPHLVAPVPEFYPPYGIPPGPQLPPRPRYPLRPPIIYNNRSIKIFKPNETTASSTITTTVTTASSSSGGPVICGSSSTVTSNDEPDSETRTDETPTGIDK